jgi:hypothetical protein
MLLISLSSYVYAITRGDSKQIIPSIKLQTTPNIYFLMLESYQGNEAFKKLYNYDNHEFNNWLESKGFKVYKNVFSPWSATKKALISMLLMEQKKDIGNLEYLTNDYLTEKKNAPVIKILKENNYVFKFMMPTNYLIYKYKSQKKFYNYNLFAFKYDALVNMQSKYKTVDNYNKEVLKDVENLVLSKDQPLFYFVKIGGVTENNQTYTGGVAHIRNDLRNTGFFHMLPELKAGYIKEVKKQNKFLKELIIKIQEKDPDSLIVAFGDHGPSFFDIARKREDLSGEGISQDDFLLDFFNVLAAIYYPKPINSSHKLYLTTEIFPMIFNALGANIEIPKFENIVYDNGNIGYQLIFKE